MRCVFHTLRQQMIKKDTPNYALADFIAPKDSGRADYIGGFCVGMHGADEFAEEFKKAHDDYNSIMAKALADRLAEASAEYLHKQARVAWGYEKPEDFTSDDLIRERYRGIRPAPGYPSQPDHTEKPILFDLLGCHAAHRRDAHRKPGHASRRRGQRAVFRPSRSRATSPQGN